MTKEVINWNNKIGGKKAEKIPCPDGIEGCLVAHYKVIEETLKQEQRVLYQPAAQEAVDILKTLGYVYQITPNGLAWVEQQEQDGPIAWLEENSAKAMSDLEKQAWIQAGRDELVETYNRPLYTKPQTKEWVGLTEDDKVLIKHDANYNQFMTAGEYADRVQALTEARLKDKNAL